jgi:hypothetical protein
MVFPSFSPDIRGDRPEMKIPLGKAETYFCPWQVSCKNLDGTNYLEECNPWKETSSEKSSFLCALSSF